MRNEQEQLRQELLTAGYAEIFYRMQMDWLPAEIQQAPEVWFGDQVEIARASLVSPCQQEADYPVLTNRRKLNDYRILAQHASMPEEIHENSLYSQLNNCLAAVKKDKASKLLFLDVETFVSQFGQCGNDLEKVEASLVELKRNYVGNNKFSLIFLSDTRSHAALIDSLSEYKLPESVTSFIFEQPVLCVADMLLFSDAIDWVRVRMPLNIGVDLSLAEGGELKVECLLDSKVDLHLVSYVDWQCMVAEQVFHIDANIEGEYPTLIGEGEPTFSLPDYDPSQFPELAEQAQQVVLTPSSRRKAAGAIINAADRFPQKNAEIVEAALQHFSPLAPSEDADVYWRKVAEFRMGKSNISRRLTSKKIQYLMLSHFNAPGSSSSDFFEFVRYEFKSFVEGAVSEFDSMEFVRTLVLSFCYLVTGYSPLRMLADGAWRSGQWSLEETLAIQQQLFAQCEAQFPLGPNITLADDTALFQLNRMVEELESQIKDNSLRLLISDFDGTLVLPPVQNGSELHTNAAPIDVWVAYLNELKADGVVSFIMTTRSKAVGENLLWQQAFGPLADVFSEKVMLGAAVLKANAIRYLVRKLQERNPHLNVKVVLLDDKKDEIDAGLPKPDERDQFNFEAAYVPVIETGDQGYVFCLEDFKQFNFVEKIERAFGEKSALVVDSNTTQLADEGDEERVFTPLNCLSFLAQQNRGQAAAAEGEDAEVARPFSP